MAGRQVSVCQGKRSRSIGTSREVLVAASQKAEGISNIGLLSGNLWLLEVVKNKSKKVTISRNSRDSY